MNLFKPYRQLRRHLYRGARVMGNVQPWFELSGRKIIRRQIHRSVGKAFGRQMFGQGVGARIIKTLLGL